MITLNEFHQQFAPKDFIGDRYFASQIILGLHSNYVRSVDLYEYIIQSRYYHPANIIEMLGSCEDGECPTIPQVFYLITLAKARMLVDNRGRYVDIETLFEEYI